jgi:hypothetical protein
MFFKKFISCFIAIVFIFSSFLQNNVYALSPDSKALLNGLPRGVSADDLKRFNSDVHIDTSNCPLWVKPLSRTSSGETKSQIPETAPVFPFPNMETGAGVHDPHWLKLSIIASVVLELCDANGSQTSLGFLRKKTAERFNMYRIPFKNTEFIFLLNNLRRTNILKSENGFDFVLDNENKVFLAVAPRLLAVWADDSDYISKDLMNASNAGIVGDVVADYAEVTKKWDIYPIEGNYPVLRAVALLEENVRKSIITALKAKYEGNEKPPLVDAILLRWDYSYADISWLEKSVSNLKGRTVYSIAAEISLLAGGLGRVMHYHGASMKRLGADIIYIEPKYQKDKHGNDITYENDPVGMKDFEKIPIAFETNVQGKWVKFNVWRGINKNGIPVYFMQDVFPEGGFPYFCNKLYSYRKFGEEPTSATETEFTEFFAKASLEVIRYLELEKKKKLGSAWQAPIIDVNDGQIVSLSAWAQIYYRDKNKIRDKTGAIDSNAEETAEIFSKALISDTTHTYFNRIKIFDFNYGLDYLRKAGIPDEFLWLFLRKDERGNFIWDFTSGGLRSADCAKAVAAIHSYEVGKWDPGVNLFGITNGDNIPYSTSHFVECMKMLGISPLKYSFLTPDEIKRVKGKAKETLGLNPNQMVVSYSGRLVPEKAGRGNAFTDDNIESMVKAGIQVVLYGNVQLTHTESNVYAMQYRALERRLNSLRQSDPEHYSGRFVFVDSFSIDEQVKLLAATDVQVQYSTRHTGASEYTEADVSANGGLQFSTPYWEGIINKQGLAINWDRLTGNTLVARDDSKEAFLEMAMIANGKFNSGDLSKLQVNSMRLSSILDATLTSAAYLRWWSKMEAQELPRKARPRVLGELNPVNPSNVFLVPVDNISRKIKKKVDRESNSVHFNVPGKGKIKIGVKIDLSIAGIIRNEKQTLNQDMISARLVDKFGKIIPLKFEERQDGTAIYTAEIEDFILDGHIEVSSGLWWVRTPIVITNETKRDTVKEFEAKKSNIAVKQIFPQMGFETIMQAGSKIITNGNEPVVFQVEVPINEDIGEYAIPVLHTDVFGYWDDAGQDQLLFSEYKYVEDRLVWTFGFVPKKSGQLTFYLTFRNAPSVKVWFGSEGNNIVLEKQGETNVDAETVDSDLNSFYKKVTSIVNLIFPNVSLSDIKSVQRLDYGGFLRAIRLVGIKDRDKELSVLIALISNIVEENSSSGMTDEIKLMVTMSVVKDIIGQWKGESFSNVALLWTKLSKTGYAKYFSAILENFRKDPMILYFLDFFIGSELASVTHDKGIDYGDGISEGKGYIDRIRNNISQAKMLEDMKRQKFSGIIVQDIKDLGMGVSNWLKAVEHYKIDIHGVQMVYLLNGVSNEERQKLLKVKPKGVVFVENLEDVRGENIVYLSSAGSEKMGELKKKGIKFIARGNCGPVIELSMALRLLNIEKAYDDQGNLSQEVISLYTGFLQRMESYYGLDHTAIAGYIDEVKRLGYIKLPEIKAFQNMWDEMQTVDIYA